MKILPAETYPPRHRTTRRFDPPRVSGKKGYQQFLPYLKWEFGFTCPFCLCHQADLVPDRSILKSGLLQVEHREAQSAQPSRRNDYDNCYLICRYCNQHRQDRPVEGPDGRTLLDPCEVPWQDHFVLEDDRLVPRDGDPDASYTQELYDFNDPIRREMRRVRRRRITERLDQLAALANRRSRLQTVMRTSRLPKDARAELEEEIREIDRQRERSRADLTIWRVIPEDAPTAPVIPPGIDEQIQELD